MTVQDLMNTPLMRDAEILCGEEHLLWELMGYIPCYGVYSHAFTNPGMLVLCDSRDVKMCSRDNWEKVFNAFPSSVLLFGEDCRELISEEILKKFKEHSLSLVIAPSGISILNFTRAFFTIVNATPSVGSKVSDWLRSLCTVKNYPVDTAEAELYGYNGRFDYIAVILSMKNAPDTGFWSETKLAEAQSIFCSEAGTREAAPLACTIDNASRLLCMMPVQRGLASSELRKRFDSAGTKLNEILYQNDWSVFVGSVAKNLNSFHSSYLHAVQTGKISHDVPGDHRAVFYYGDSYMYTALLEFPSEELQSLLQSTLGPILENEELVDTLSAFLSNSENYKMTSDSTYLHVNTIRYRITRVCELLCCDIEDAQVRYRLRTAIFIYYHLKNQAGFSRS